MTVIVTISLFSHFDTGAEDSATESRASWEPFCRSDSRQVHPRETENGDQNQEKEWKGGVSAFWNIWMGKNGYLCGTKECSCRTFGRRVARSTISSTRWNRWISYHLMQNKTILDCVTRAPLLYFVRSWVCLSVSQACVTPFQISTLCNI